MSLWEGIGCERNGVSLSEENAGGVAQADKGKGQHMRQPGGGKLYRGRGCADGAIAPEASALNGVLNDGSGLVYT